ncbi:MAG: class I SAM-dependent methyltransferase [Deltaproteobacteria bacterium]|nr:class I SAM-dependent methyltransferase [Deltaproteobacteria bacterium]
MALIFARLARNFIKNGYFPTNEETLARLQTAIAPADDGKAMRLLDPCCGEGAALADLAHGLAFNTADQPQIETLGIEFDRERAWHAKGILTRCIHADIHDVVVKPRSCGLLFLNPPYGFGVKDTENLRRDEKAERLERTFLKKAVPWLQPGGILVYIVPFYALDEEIRIYLASHFTRLTFWMAPEQRFQQCVILGVKGKVTHPRKEVLDMLKDAQEGKFKEQVLPEVWQEEPYEVPSVRESEFNFHAVRMDGEQLADELKRHHCNLLWNTFDTTFSQARAAHRRPLRDMTQWHLALALAAGQVTGCITSKTGRTLLIKGDTFKTKKNTVSVDVDEKGNTKQTVTMLDQFVPVINAIEFTPDHRLGQIVKIS